MQSGAQRRGRNDTTSGNGGIQVQLLTTVLTDEEFLYHEFNLVDEV
jgi:hypothetical protein